MTEGEIIVHKGKFANPEALFHIGEKVILQVDEAPRRLNARIHSAGHLLDVAFHMVGFSNTGTKGNHFPESPYVEFEGKFPATANKEKAIADIEAQMNSLIKVFCILWSNTIISPHQKKIKWI